jgi:hypothetical protein
MAGRAAGRVFEHAPGKDFVAPLGLGKGRFIFVGMPTPRATDSRLRESVSSGRSQTPGSLPGCAKVASLALDAVRAAFPSPVWVSRARSCAAKERSFAAHERICAAHERACAANERSLVKHERSFEPEERCFGAHERSVSPQERSFAAPERCGPAPYRAGTRPARTNPTQRPARDSMTSSKRTAVRLARVSRVSARSPSPRSNAEARSS